MSLHKNDADDNIRLPRQRDVAAECGRRATLAVVKPDGEGYFCVQGRE
jgi:hypothetical protein